MLYVQVYYLFENLDWFQGYYFGDFIVEYIGQICGWFYILYVLVIVFFDWLVFKICVVYGIVFGFDGQKMSKLLCNYLDVIEVFDCDGFDVMWWFLMVLLILCGGNLIVIE